MTALLKNCAMGISISVLMSAASFADTLKIIDVDGEELAIFDRDSLEDLGLEKLTTETPWTDGTVTFEGVELKTVLEKSGVNDATVTGLAFDDYASTLPADVIREYRPIVATRMNGKILTVDDKGPFWVMFDFDGIEEETSIELRAYAVWRLIELEVE